MSTPGSGSSCHACCPAHPAHHGRARRDCPAHYDGRHGGHPARRDCPARCDGHGHGGHRAGHRADHLLSVSGPAQATPVGCTNRRHKHVCSCAHSRSACVCARVCVLAGAAGAWSGPAAWAVVAGDCMLQCRGQYCVSVIPTLPVTPEHNKNPRPAQTTGLPGHLLKVVL